MNEDGIVEVMEALGLDYGRGYPGSTTWGPHISVSCFPAGTPVITDRGLVDIDRIEIGSLVLTADHGFQPVKALHRRLYSGEMIRFRFRGLNQDIYGTSNHRVFAASADVVRKSKDVATKRAYRSGQRSLRGDLAMMEVSQEIVEIGKLNKGDRLRLPLLPISTTETLIDLQPSFYETVYTMPKGGLRKKAPGIPTNIKLTPDLAHLLGLWVAEGSVNTPPSKSGLPDTTIFSFRLNEPSVQRCIDLISSIFGIDPSVYPRPKQNSHKIHVHNWLLAHWLVDVAGHGAFNKRVPSFIFSSSKPVIQAFIDGLIAGDGSRYSGKNSQAGSWTSISTVSPTIAAELPILLGAIGKACRVTSRAARTDKNGVNHRHSYEICIADGQHFDAGRRFNGVFWYPIKSIDRVVVSNLPVFNITVENDESYTVGSLAVKNCPLAPKTHNDPVDGNLSCSIQLVPDGPSGARCFSGNCAFKGSFLRLIKLAVDIRGQPPELMEVYKKVEGIEKLTLDAIHARTVSQNLKDPSLTTDPEVLEIIKANAARKQAVEDRDVLPESAFERFKGSIPAYAIQRGITIESAKRWNLGFDKEGGYLVFPMRRRDGKLVGLIGRAVSPNAPRRHHNYMGLDKAKHLFGAQLLEKSKPVVIVEGCIDAIKTEQALGGQASVVASLGEGFSPQHVKTITSVNPPAVYIFTDGDAAGHAMASKIHYALHGRATMMLMETPWGPIIDAKADGTPVRKKVDPGDLPADYIQRLFRSARLIKKQISWTYPVPEFQQP